MKPGELKSLILQATEAAQRTAGKNRPHAAAAARPSEVLQELGIEPASLLHPALTDDTLTRLPGRLLLDSSDVGATIRDAIALADDRHTEASESNNGAESTRASTPHIEHSSIDRFTLGDELGQGAMGRVLEAYDPEIRRTVAIKLLKEEEQFTEARLARFVAEAQICGQLEHPHIVPVHELGVTNEGLFYFVMKRVRGRSLSDVLLALAKNDPRATEGWTRHRLLSAFVQVCHAVGYAHRRGVLHRDLKPNNIMLGDHREVLVMDWGVAGLIGRTDPTLQSETVDRVTLARTLDGALVGTPGFMSPEQARGEIATLDARSDVWSLGAVLYQILTIQPAFRGSNAVAILVQAASKSPPDPRQRAPERDIPDEIAEICNKAMRLHREDRYASATELATAVEGFLEGSRRRAESGERLVEAERYWELYRRLEVEQRRLTDAEAQLSEETPPWTPIQEKLELLEMRTRLEGITEERESAFEAVVATCEGALMVHPSNVQAKRMLARVYWHRFEEAERRGDVALARHCAARVRVHNTGDFTELLDQGGRLTLRTDPPGAEVICERFDRQGLIWSLVDQRRLGPAPLEGLALHPGSYRLTIRHPEAFDTVYPVHITRAAEWESGADPIPLYSKQAIGQDWIYVPAGPFLCGGDPRANNSLPRKSVWVDGFFIATFPISVEQYCDYINALAETEPDLAWSRVPRQEAGIKEAGGQFWERPAAGEPYRVPERDRDGDVWDPKWPVFGISWEDGMAYAAWRSEVEGHDYSLPSELEWEKAARGVDGRSFPWGDRFDSTLCKMRDSRPGECKPEPVGAFETDVSVYGVRDLAGSMGELCRDLDFNGDDGRRVVRGGGWSLGERNCRVGERYGVGPRLVLTFFGLRLIRRSPL